MILKKFEFYGQIFENTQISNFMNARPVEAKISSHFLEFFERA